LVVVPGDKRLPVAAKMPRDEPRVVDGDSIEAGRVEVLRVVCFAVLEAGVWACEPEALATAAAALVAAFCDTAGVVLVVLCALFAGTPRVRYPPISPVKVGAAVV
jgi:hypothetical protein